MQCTRYTKTAVSDGPITGDNCSLWCSWWVHLYTHPIRFKVIKDCELATTVKILYLACTIFGKN